MSAEWKRKNPELAKASDAAYRARNRDKLRAKNREAMARRRAADPIAARERERAWEAASRERRLPMRRVRYAANAEVRRAQRREWFYSHREAERQAKKDWYAANKQQSSEACREWRLNNPEKNRAKANAYRIRRLAAAGHHTVEQWLALCESYLQRCAYCGAIEPLTIDHAVPLSRGGSDSIDNIRPACKSCNCRKRTKTEDEFVGPELMWAFVS